MDGREWTDEERQTWREDRAAWLAGQIAKACGSKLTDDTEIAAMTLQRLFGRRLRTLLGNLRQLVPEAVEDEADLRLEIGDDAVLEAVGVGEVSVCRGTTSRGFPRTGRAFSGTFTWTRHCAPCHSKYLRSTP